MKVVFENQSSATTAYQGKATTVQHAGRRYQMAGVSHGPSLSMGQRLAHVLTIVGLAVVAFFSGGLVLASPSFRNAISWRYSELKAGKQINLHYTPQEPAQWQKDAINPFIEQIQNSIEIHPKIPEQLHAASCCIAIQYNHGEAKANMIPFADRARVTKQFYFDSEDCTSLTKTSVMERIEDIGQELASAIANEIDVATTQLAFGCVLLRQDSPDEPIKASYYSQSAHASCGVAGTTSIENAFVNGVLQFVYFEPADVVASDGQQILQGPRCILI